MATSFSIGDFVIPRFGKQTFFGVIIDLLGGNRLVVRWSDDTETIEHESGLLPDHDINLSLVIDELVELAEAEGFDETWADAS